MSEILFLAGSDPAGSSDPYYALARQFVLQRDASIPTVGPAAGNAALSLEGIFEELTTRAAASPPAVFDTISIVSRAAGVGGMDMPLHTTDEVAGGVTMRSSVGNAVLAARANAAGSLQPPGSGAITPKTRIVLYGCDVGRDTAFLTSLGELFGGPGDVSAPVRVAVFRLKDGKVKHRLARTWSVLWGATSIDSTETAQWPTARDTFTQKADLKFKDSATGSVINSHAANATLDSTKDEFFFGEVFSVRKTAFATALPVRSAVITSSDDDDTTEPVVVTAADMTVGNADVSDPEWATMNIARLASVIDVDVAVSNATQYRTVSFGTQKAPATGPLPAATADGSPPPPPPDPDAAAPNALQEFTDEFLAAGGQQADLDTFLSDATAPRATVPAAVEDGTDPALTAEEIFVPPAPPSDDEELFA